jgi:hypothetical protein
VIDVSDSSIYLAYVAERLSSDSTLKVKAIPTTPTSLSYE